MKPASFSTGAPLPFYWEKHVLAAYLRMMGSTQEDAGRAVGRSKRTIAEWEAHKATWVLAREQARQRWREELTDASRVTLLATIRDGNGLLALHILERTDDDLAPAKQRHEVTLDGGGLAALLAHTRETAHADAQPEPSTGT